MKIYIEDIAEKMECSGEEWSYYLDKKSYKLIVTSKEYLDRNDYSNFHTWEEGYINAAINIKKDPERYILIPSSINLEEITIMEEFIEYIKDENIKAVLEKAISEEGAIRRFKDTVKNLGLLDKWDRFKNKTNYRMAVKMCNNNLLEYAFRNKNNSEN